MGEGKAPPRRAPSIRSRLANALLLWSLAWGLAVGTAVWLAAVHEVDELLDDTLLASADLLASMPFARGDAAPAPSPGASAASARSAPSAAAAHTEAVPALPTQNIEASERLAWQVVSAQGQVLQRSARAPAVAWQTAARAGYFDAEAWHVYGLALGSDGRMLYTAQSHAERFEARSEVAWGTVLATFAVGLVGHVWLRSRVRHELAPLGQLADSVRAWDAWESGQNGSRLPAPALPRHEVQLVHHALDALTQRLMLRLANERAFSAHAAHALRTPLAGIDTQLALALREAPPPMRERLQRTRDAASRLQAVVVALLGLFRSGSEPQRQPVLLAELMARLPVPRLQLQIPPDLVLDADPDLLAAALANLLDNSQRHGATEVSLSGADEGTLLLVDNGRGMDAPTRLGLQARLDAQDFEGHSGLGLMLADRIARAHGGRLKLLPAAQGCAISLGLARAREDAGGLT